MRIHIRLYGAMRVVAGQPEVALSFEAAATPLTQVLDALLTAYPRVQRYLFDASGSLLPSIRVLVNDARISTDALAAVQLHDEDRLALLAPMAGGGRRSML